MSDIFESKDPLLYRYGSLGLGYTVNRTSKNIYFLGSENSNTNTLSIAIAANRKVFKDITSIIPAESNYTEEEKRIIKNNDVYYTRSNEDLICIEGYASLNNNVNFDVMFFCNLRSIRLRFKIYDSNDNIVNTIDDSLSYTDFYKLLTDRENKIYLNFTDSELQIMNNSVVKRNQRFRVNNIINKTKQEWVSLLKISFPITV